MECICRSPMMLVGTEETCKVFEQNWDALSNLPELTGQQLYAYGYKKILFSECDCGNGGLFCFTRPYLK